MRASEAFGHLVDELANWSEIGRSVQIHVVQGVLVSLYHSFEAIDSRIRNVSIEGEAVVALLLIGRDLCTETKDWDLLVSVVVLQDGADLLDGAKILVVLEVVDGNPPMTGNIHCRRGYEPSSQAALVGSCRC